MIYKKLVDAYLPFAQKEFGFNNIPKINYIEDAQNAANPIGNTGYYNPATMEVFVYVTGRHPKDILRSVSHELVHHAQNCRGEFTPDVMEEAGEGYAQNSPRLRKMEIEANARGATGVRDSVDRGLYKNLFNQNENKQKGIKKMIDLDALTDAIMSNIMEKKDCGCGKSHKGMTCEQYAESKEEKPLDEWINDERYNLLMQRFGISEKKKAKNPGPYKTGMKKGYDDDGDGVPNRADKKPNDGSIKEKKLSKSETKEKERVVKGMKKSEEDFEERYPGKGKEVMYATATNIAKKGKK